MINAALLALVILLLAAGQILFKTAGLAIQGKPIGDALFGLALLPSFYVALAVYGFATVAWIYVLSRMQLAIAYPWMAGSMVIVPLMALILFGERVGPLFWPGMGLVIVGLILTQLGSW
ncbi:MAG TPA: hypothetical protein VE650_08915 [Acetobacteraceae bacterium]|jgi:undecaprenyl phosphate-alpha-L-ara4N flippase subunit ArnE|nr:hypothetical protein [Acetobacteraceae bacterium]